MGRLEVQGIVAKADNLPYVQFRQLDDDGSFMVGWQSTPAEAREMAQQMIEASMNAVYDAALIAWAKEMWPEDELMGAKLVTLVRDYRADAWGLPDQPEDWRPSEE
jgi:hypothetical protein